MVMKKKLICLMLSASMILLLFTGCSGSEGTVANSSEAEKNETVVENAGSEVTEIVEEEEPVMEAQEGSTVAETNASDTAEKRYLVKSERLSMPSPDGKGKSFFVAREYDYDEFGHKIHMHVYNYEGQKGDEYYEYELDDEGRIIQGIIINLTNIILTVGFCQVLKVSLKMGAVMTQIGLSMTPKNKKRKLMRTINIK